MLGWVLCSQPEWGTGEGPSGSGMLWGTRLGAGGSGRGQLPGRGCPEAEAHPRGGCGGRRSRTETGVQATYSCRLLVRGSHLGRTLKLAREAAGGAACGGGDEPAPEWWTLSPGRARCACPVPCEVSRSRS